MKISLFIISFVAFTGCYAQNCANTSEGLTPIVDLATTYLDSSGRLYKNPPTNTTPALHDSVMKRRGLEIAPRDTGGNVDWSSGKIGVLLLGHSNMKRVAKAFTDSLATSGMSDLIHGNLLFIRCGVDAANGLKALSDSTSISWTNHIPDSITTQSGDVDQVGIIICYSSYRPKGSGFPAGPDSVAQLANRFARVAQIKLPNVKQIFFVNSVYGGYASPTSREPEDYRNASWGFRQSIHTSITNVDSISHSKQIGRGLASVWSGNAPSMDWLVDLVTNPNDFGSDLWADGSASARSDGHDWECSDYEADGSTHLDVTGRRKVISELFRILLKSDKTPWFRKSANISVQP